MTVISILVSLLFFAGYYLLCAAALKLGGAGSIVSSMWKDKKSLLAVLALLLASTAGVIYLISLDRFIYYWDYAGYWDRSISQTQLMFTDPGRALRQLVHSISSSDYNDLLPTIAALPQRIAGIVFGGSYRQYVITNHIVFMIPAIAVQALCAVKLFDMLCPQSRISRSHRFVLGVLVSVLFPASYYPLLHGYMDVGILCPMAAAVFLLLDYDLTAAFTLKSQWRDLVFALLLLLTWLCRRYAAFFILGIAAAMICQAALQLVARRNIPAAPKPAAGRKKTAPSHTLRQMEHSGHEALQNARRSGLIHATMHLIYIGAVSLLILLVFFRAFFLNALSTNYATAYSAYNAAFPVKLKTIGRSFGVCAAIAPIAVCIYAAVTKRCGRQLVCLLVTVTVTSLSFFTVQSMGEHHRYLLDTPLYLFAAASVFLLMDRPVPLLCRVLPGLCCLSLLCNALYAFVPPARQPLSGVRTLLCDAYTPLRRNDMDELHALRDYLDEKTAAGGQSIYVLASSRILNDDILRRIDQPQSMSALPTLLLTNHVDLRDGFPARFLTADVIVTTDPIQTHLAAGSQEVVRYLAQEVQDSASPIGRHYRKDERSFVLDRGVTVFIYDRVTPFGEPDIRYLKDYFSSRYPDQPSLFSDRIALAE